MFDIGWSEILVIAVVALVVIGPKELPGVLRAVGQWTGKIRKMAAEFQSQFQEALREAEMADLKKHADDIKTAATSMAAGLDPFDIARDVEASITGTPSTTTSSTTEPVSPATPAPAAEAPPAAAAPVESASAEPAPAEPTSVTDNVPIAPDATPPAKGGA